jgi:hypothetical protein
VVGLRTESLNLLIASTSGAREFLYTADAIKHGPLLPYLFHSLANLFVLSVFDSPLGFRKLTFVFGLPRFAISEAPCQILMTKKHNASI